MIKQNKRIPMTPNPPRRNQPGRNKNNHHPEKLTAVIDEGRHEQRQPINKNPNPKRALEQNKPLKPKSNAITIATRRLKSI